MEPTTTHANHNRSSRNTEDKLDSLRAEVMAEFRRLGSRVESLAEAVIRQGTRLEDFRDWFRPDHAESKARLLALETASALHRGKSGVLYALGGALGTTGLGALVTVLIKLLS